MVDSNLEAPLPRAKTRSSRDKKRTGIFAGRQYKIVHSEKLTGSDAPMKMVTSTPASQEIQGYVLGTLVLCPPPLALSYLAE